MEKAYRNLGYVFALLIPLTFLGFYKTYFMHFPSGKAGGFYDHLHATTASLWLFTLIAQPLLIRYKKVSLHKTLGKLSYIIFPLLILSFIPQMMKSYQSNSPIINPTFDIVLLLLFYYRAMKNVHDVTVHMRYMIGTALIFIGPTLGRICGMWLELGRALSIIIPYGGTILLLIVLIYWDKTNGRNYLPYKTILGAFVIYFISLMVYGYTMT
jgi:hypothetical protein